MNVLKMTRRALLATTAAAGLALGAAPALAQTPPGVLIVGQIAEPKSLDPHTVTAVNDFRILMNMYDGLVRYAPGTLEVAPSLAESWEISEDGTEYTFNLREGVTFHDGSSLDAEAVVFNFERMLNEDHPYYETGPFPLAFFFSSVQTVEALDELTVKFTLNEPYAPFLSNLAYPTGLIVSPAAVMEHGADFGRNPSGTGAFTFGEWRSNEAVVVEGNPDYWDGAPALDAVVFRPITDANTRTAEMLAGGIDLMVEVPPVALSEFQGDSYTVHEQAGPHVWFLILNAKEGPFADVRVRQAANYAINKEAIVNDVLEGTAEVAAGPTPPAFAWAYNPDLEPYPYDPERARELIAEAGAEGAELTFFVTEGGSGMLDPVAMGTAIQADLAAVGFDVTIETYEWNTFLGEVNPGLEGKADMAEMAWMTNDPDTLPFLALRTAAWPDQGGFNSGYYSNPEVDALLEQARVATTQDERAELYKQMQVIVQEDAPWVFVANWKQNAVTSANVENFSLEPSFFLLLDDVVKN
ncbi:ABC transporter substrate-binding protein [Ponticoccus sp. SC2-23]|uniref:ABC transporter substrate-binding protein n=1 Tax=Alexandriicola marinus TaxID=2081710 RepID=UPI000FDB89E4|nr:ABC transporter substrate-binding protein [Alexandriicola marinus]MBM1219517.1 ABC transporter substrate-binding protein [Ponticoccus sp. SC6-9]MBM1223411.1 ABC transporter substrate-binding protein [Ponticoccus sp. SC6-15]MBM1229330.1 ABC transporter substrate-binding protein [Ponticoccus sp. SC6-38]MBM1232377.1 ABC transporter substrate-binding protein [Ponticoccus sp. SC6-45]MBM1237673.1 ABC transporter substrate-binding protein [Ponticoccus sp. SC6-49]MBM1241388.1 ABC transporter subst